MDSWNKRDIVALKKKYKELYDKTTDSNKRLEIISTLASIDAVLDYYKPKVFSFFSNKKNPNIVMSEDLLFLQEYGLYAPYIRNFIENSEFIKGERVKNTPLKIPISVLFEKIRNFFISLGDVYKDKIVELMDGNLLRLRCVNSNNNETGVTIPIRGTKMVYISIGRVNSFQDYITSAHECGHAISYLMNSGSLFSHGSYMFSEMIAIFFETIANDEIAANLGLIEEGQINKYQTYNDYLYTSKIICAKMDLFSSVNSNVLKSPQRIKNFFIEYCDLDNKDISTLLHEGISIASVYVISYLAAIELYLIYKNDKEKALSLLTNITMHEEINPKKYLDYVINLGIIPGAHINDYYEMLVQEKKAIKKNT